MLELKNISIGRGGRAILSSLSAVFDHSSITVIRAPNGGGKSTLLRAIAGLLPVQSGSILTGGEDPVFCGHLDAVKSAMSVRESLAFWHAIYGQSASSEALDALSLSELMDTPVAYLSAGQKRRLGLARAFIAPTKIKLFDEPTTALDAAHRDAFWAMIQTAADQGATILFSSHDAEVPVAAKTLDLAAFAPKATPASLDPFLDGDFA